MIVAARPQTQQSAPALPGTWKLVAGRAITLQPREEGTFRVAHGQVWATYDGPHAGSLNEMGDHVVGAGQALRLRAGQRLVVESWNWQSPSYFSWEPQPVRARESAPRFTAVVQPLADLRMAIALGAGALARLVAGLAGIAWGLLARRARSADAAAFGARACGAQGSGR